MFTFSVIIPNYNYAEFVGAAIESVLAQTFHDFELIVVDDGSMDNSRSIISSYEGRLKALYIENGGAARACLRGVSEASGRYIWILDSDDEMMSNALAIVADHLYVNPAKIQFQLLPVGPSGQSIGDPFPRFFVPYTRSRMIKEIQRNGSYLTPPTSGNVFRADVFQIVGDIDYEQWIDGITYLISPFLGDVVTISEPLAKYRIHDRNDSGFGKLDSERIKRRRREFLGRIDHLERLLPSLGIHQFAIDRRLLSYVAGSEIAELVAAGQRPTLAAIFKFWRALAHSLMPLRTKLVSAAWAALLLVSSRQARRTLLSWRLNPWSRPQFLRRLKNLIR